MAQFIPEEHFKGINDIKSECPLAFITPTGTDKAAEKRIETVKSWSRGWKEKDKETEAKHFEIIKNEAMLGFKISRQVSRWSTSNVVWRIEDPRKFELEISSGNMAYLIANCTIEKGEFMNELIWCRSGKDNFLLPVGSEEHAKYTKNSNALKAKLGIRDIEIGDHIHAMDGTDGIFLGGFYLLVFERYAYDDSNPFLKVQRKYFVKDIETGDITTKSGFKGLSIIEKFKEENKDYSAFLNKYESGGSDFIHAFKKKPNALEIAHTARYIETEEKENNNRGGQAYLAQIEDGSVYSVYSYSHSSSGHYERITIDNMANTYNKTSIQEYGKSYHSMSTLGLSNMFNPSKKIADLIKESSKHVKLVITIDGEEITVLD